MKKNILFCGFNGNNNTAKLLLDKINFSDKLYLENDFDISVEQIKEKLNNHYDLLIMFGQKPIIKSIYIEIMGSNKAEKIKTNFDYKKFQDFFLSLNYNVKISNNAGNYLCNNVYYNSLTYIKNYNLNLKSIFIHIPTVKNIFNLEKFANDILEFTTKNV